MTDGQFKAVIHETMIDYAGAGDSESDCTLSHLDTLLFELCDVAEDLPTELGCHLPPNELTLIACAPPSGMDHPGIASPGIVRDLRSTAV